MERHFEVELQALRDRLLTMGSLAETMIHKGIKALVDRDESLVQAVLAHEEEMDLLCIEIDDRCFTQMALRQPMASDLRLLVASIKINSDLERIGDQAVSIALRARSLIGQTAHRHSSHGRHRPGDGARQPRRLCGPGP